jgi:hypothetical protein
MTMASRADNLLWPVARASRFGKCACTPTTNGKPSRNKTPMKPRDTEIPARKANSIRQSSAKEIAQAITPWPARLLLVDTAVPCPVSSSRQALTKKIPIAAPTLANCSGSPKL